MVFTTVFPFFPSAGVGRTGSFIIIDHVLDTLTRQADSSVDVFFMVQEMRKCRVNMIQTIVRIFLFVI